MDISFKELDSLIRHSFDYARDDALKKFPQSLDKGLAHKGSSKIWLNELAQELKSFIGKDDPNIRIFTRSLPNKREFGLNELLYDISICRTSKCNINGNMLNDELTNDLIQDKEFHYVSECLWQIESEFAKNRREALKDFNKLVLGSSANKLFIGPTVSNNNIKEYYGLLLNPARFCSGNIYLAIVPHPKEWQYKSALDISVHFFRDRRWEPEIEEYFLKK